MTDWHEIIGSVPRRSFSPDVVWADLEPGPWVRIDRTTEPAKWDEVVALDQPLVTQFEDGRTEGEGLASSSLSMPTMVVEFLDQLDPFDDHRVLDIGTGAGWTAALLSARRSDPQSPAASPGHPRPRLAALFSFRPRCQSRRDHHPRRAVRKVQRLSVRKAWKRRQSQRRRAGRESGPVTGADQPRETRSDGP
ncbi:hypothetical protein K8Z49_16890 [Actinomadura madurae]